MHTTLQRTFLLSFAALAAVFVMFGLMGFAHADSNDRDTYCNRTWGEHARDRNDCDRKYNDNNYCDDRKDNDWDKKDHDWDRKGYDGKDGRDGKDGHDGKDWDTAWDWDTNRSHASVRTHSFVSAYAHASIR